MILKIAGPLVALREWLNPEDLECSTYVMASTQPVTETEDHGPDAGESWLALCVLFELADDEGAYSEEYLIRDHEEAAVVLGAIDKVRQALDLIKDGVTSYLATMQATDNADGRWGRTEVRTEVRTIIEVMLRDHISAKELRENHFPIDPSIPDDWIIPRNSFLPDPASTEVTAEGGHAPLLIHCAVHCPVQITNHN